MPPLTLDSLTLFCTGARVKKVAPVLLLVLLPCFGLGCGSSVGSASPRHVILVTIDTLRADHVGFYGYPRPTTPFLDSLAKHSVVFERAYSSSSHTAPSHTSLMTSLQPAQHRVLQNGERLNPEVTTLATMFRDAGYRTGAFTAVSFLEGLRNGFEEFHAGKGIASAETVLDAARQWIAEQPPDTPLFVWIHLYDVHEWHADERLDHEAVEAMRREAPTGDDLLRFLVKEHGLQEDGLLREKVLDAVQRYDGQLRSTDRELGRFFEDLEASGFQENALWIITADHGEALGNHDAMGHGIHIYHEQLHVPLLVHAPGGEFPPRRVSETVALVDVAPTLAEWLGVRWAPSLATSQGRSLLDLLTGKGEDRPPEAIFAQRRPVTDHQRQEGWEEGEIYALQSANHKIIVHSSGHHEYFDLQRDPFELNNLFDPESREQRALLRQAVRHYRQLIKEGERIGSGEINEEWVGELKALGYL